MRSSILAATFVAITLPAFAEPSLSGADTDTYALEKNHAFLTWTVRHKGLSGYTVNFTDFDATLNFDAKNPTASTLSVTINPMALQTNYPDPVKKVEWETELSTDAKFLNAGDFPEITFQSTSAALTDEFEGTVTGDLTFLGVTKPVTLNVSYNGVTNVPWFGQRDVIGFDATATLDRTEWGMTALNGIVSNEVVIEFSGEFLQAE